MHRIRQNEHFSENPTLEEDESKVTQNLSIKELNEIRGFPSLKGVHERNEGSVGAIHLSTNNPTITISRLEYIRLSRLKENNFLLPPSSLFLLMSPHPGALYTYILSTQNEVLLFLRVDGRWERLMFVEKRAGNAKRWLVLTKFLWLHGSGQHQFFEVGSREIIMSTRLIQIRNYVDECVIINDS